MAEPAWRAWERPVWPPDRDAVVPPAALRVDRPMAGTGVERVRRGPRAPPLVKRADLRRRGSAGAGHGRNPAGLHGDHRDAAAAPHWGVAARAELSPVLGGRLRWRMGMVVVVPTEPGRA